MLLLLAWSPKGLSSKRDESCRLIKKSSFECALRSSFCLISSSGLFREMKQTTPRPSCLISRRHKAYWGYQVELNGSPHLVAAWADGY